MATPYIFMIHFNTILPCMSKSSKRSLSCMFFFIKTLYESLSAPVCGTFAAHLILLDLIAATFDGVLKPSLCNFSPASYRFLHTSIPLHVLLSNGLSLCFCSVWDQISHQHLLITKVEKYINGLCYRHKSIFAKLDYWSPFQVTHLLSSTFSAFLRLHFVFLSSVTYLQPIHMS